MKKIVLLCLLACSFSGMSQSYFLQMGINNFEEEKYDEAAIFFSKELQKHPKEGQAYYYLAKIHMNKDENLAGLKKIDLAIANLVDSDTVMARAWIVKGDIYQRLTDTVKFESAYLKALKLFPALPEVYLERASSYVAWSMDEKAKVDLLKVIALDQTHFGARSLLCSIYSKEKKYEAMIKESNKMIALEPANVESYDFRAMAYFYLKKYDLAIQDAYTALTLNDRVARLRFNYLVYARKNYGLALAKISSLINEYPQKDNWYLLRAQIYADKRDFDKSITDFTHIFSIVDVDLYGFYFAKRAQVYGAMGLHNKAISDYSGAIENDSTDADNFAARGDEYQLSSKFDLAIADYDRAIQLAPESASFYMQRGLTKDIYLGDVTASLDDYTAAIEIDRNLANAYLYRGRSYQKNFKDSLRANDDFRHVLELDTVASTMGSVRQYALAGLGKEHEAKTWMTKILAEYPEDVNYYDAACLYSILKNLKESIANLDMAFQKGYRDFMRVGIDKDLDYVKQSPEFKALLVRWKSKYEVKTSTMPSIRSEDSKITGTYVIPFKSRESGTFEVASKINGLPLNMIFDTGSSDISISRTEVDFMMKNGYLSEKDYVGTKIYNLANGMNEESKTILLKRVEFGGLVLKNVMASIGENREAGMLFGQSAMSRYGTITIDNKKKQLVITGSSK